MTIRMSLSTPTACAFAFLATVGVPNAAVACAVQGVTQLRVIEHEGHRSPSSLLSYEGFPALSESSEYIAVLDIDELTGQTAVLHTVGFLGRFEGPWTLSSRKLIDTQETPLDEEGLNTFGRSVTFANEWLCSRRFRPMDALYDLRYTFHGRFPRPAVWELEWSEWSVKYDYTTNAVVVSAGRVAPRSLRVARPVEVAGPPGGHPHHSCRISGLPLRAWADERSRLLVFRISNVGGHHCDRPDTWLIERLP